MVVVVEGLMVLFLVALGDGFDLKLCLLAVADGKLSHVIAPQVHDDEEEPCLLNYEEEREEVDQC